MTLKPEQRHLISDRACADLAEIIGPELGQPVQVAVTLGSVPEQETPLEIEHRLYLGVREQVTRIWSRIPTCNFAAAIRRRASPRQHRAAESLTNTMPGLVPG